MAVVDDDAAACRPVDSTNTDFPRNQNINDSLHTKKSTRIERQLLQKRANRARHRLLSIRHDVETFVRPTLKTNDSLKDLPFIANERCGSWYVHSLFRDHHSCYFKSTDGHEGTWNLSLKRLNLNVIEIISKNMGCVVVDASVRKEMPDSFARTIPLWCVCMNRIAAIYRRELGMPCIDEWDETLYTPEWLVSSEEQTTMETLIDIRVQELYRSKAIVDPHWLVTTLNRPLRPYWITPQQNSLKVAKYFYPFVCLNASKHCINRIWMEEESFWYTPGAADDHEGWARHLTPRLFWDNVNVVLDVNKTDDNTDRAIDVLVEQERHKSETFETNDVALQTTFGVIGETNIAVGTRRSGRPPECWQRFDAILNVTDVDYPNIHETCYTEGNRFYLQLPVREGKRDKSELERWMAVGIIYCTVHAQQKRHILIHCAQGKDRSVAVAIAITALFCDLTFPLKWKEELWTFSIPDLMESIERYNETSSKDDCLYKSSGLPQRLVETLQGRKGHNCLLEWLHNGLGLPKDEPLATKETLRIALHLLRQDRAKAEPSRSTMQKLNRFFMSGAYYNKE